MLLLSPERKRRQQGLGYSVGWEISWELQCEASSKWLLADGKIASFRHILTGLVAIFSLVSCWNLPWQGLTVAPTINFWMYKQTHIPTEAEPPWEFFCVTVVSNDFKMNLWSALQDEVHCKYRGFWHCWACTSLTSSKMAPILDCFQQLEFAKKSKNET